MTGSDFKKLLDETVKPLQQGLDGVRSGLDEVRSDLSEVKQELKEVKDIQEQRILPSLTYIETTVKSYADRYVINEDHIRRVDKRLTTVEDNLGIQPPQELMIPSVE
ncbi:hypothetical protein A3B45_01975 [Candidatus Daviesbacteria bacterium RIFCSPLOWO2_01_FULL_39_12]|uniref:Uncharacterized protein n=1 Tax=Candidatus Daviesbacteria bacterium RIFCSPLOWO2_01_FULL_39_12 TaxID=1797785 RepID=A0A1F5KMA2_9BACT|nr:MAG: hypothetical protein A3D79_03160 [Candidatus Daviesbacteria bacterium RIFCSPHIGHO2_02_FULL_39_8]OGE41969.1 MAG: hypothetical protein A3B45_01975 [Candidatus Daviesbacteria bacterium RIFCSPLOWO2_01_FULL_39_12]